MPAPSTVTGDLVVTGQIVATTNKPTADTVGDSEMDATDPIGTDKMLKPVKAFFSQAQGTDSTAVTQTVHVGRFGGTINDVRATIETAPTGGDKTVTIDVLKNGTTVLSSTQSFSASDANGDVKVATLSVTSYVADDVIEVDIAVAGSTGSQGQGVAVIVDMQENNA